MAARRKPGEGGDGDFALVRILLRGPKEWNEWRAANPNVDIDLREANLIEANLIEANLSRADLSRADLSVANLRRAYLNGAHLIGAKLIRAHLIGTNLRGANLFEADLSGATLIGADLFEADLRGASLSRADLFEANLSGANLRGASLIGADLFGANLFEANLSGADLEGANLSKAHLRGADLKGAKLNGALRRAERFEIFTSNDSIEDAEEVFEAAKAFVHQLGLETQRAVPGWEKGSLRRRMTTWLFGDRAPEYVGKRADIAENVLLGKADIEATVALAKAAVDLENAFKGKKGAIAIDMGLFVFLRKSSEDGDGHTFFKRLTVEERALLNDDPTLLGDPDRLFDAIKDMKKVSASDVALLEDKAS